MYRKSWVLYTILLLVSIIITFFLTKLYFTKKLTVVPDTTKEEFNYCPVCNYGLCPHFESYSFDDDSPFESVVEVPTAMTKGAGEIWVLDDNGKVLKNLGGGAWVDYKLNHDDKLEIIVSWASKFSENGLSQIERVEKHFENINGEIILTKEEFVSVEKR